MVRVLGSALRRIATIQRAAAWEAGIVVCLWCAVGNAQVNHAVSAKDLVQPWTLATEVLLSLAHSFDYAKGEQRRRLQSALGALDAQLSDLEAQEQTIAIGIASKAEYAYIVSVDAEQAAKQLAQIEQTVDAVFGLTAASALPEAVAVQQSLATLRGKLADKNGLERDVLQALGSGSRNEIQSLAVTWWDGSEGVGKCRQAVAMLRRTLAD